jgi:hypothetical protein
MFDLKMDASSEIRGSTLLRRAKLDLAGWLPNRQRICPMEFVRELSKRLQRRLLLHHILIMIFLPGGPSHQDMFDLKMDAP